MKSLQMLIEWLGFAAVAFLVNLALQPGFIWLVLCYFILLAASIVLHEFGHTLAAACAGARVLHMSIGFVFIERRLRAVRFHLRWPAPGTLGMALAVPDFSSSARRQMLWMLIGGPLANALAAVLCLSLTWPYSETMEPASAMWFAFGVLNATSAIANLIPVRRSFPSDGLQLVFWWRNAPDAEPSRRILQACDQSLRGILACEIPQDQLDWFETCQDMNTRFFGRYIALRAAQERPDEAAFASVLARSEGELKEAAFASVFAPCERELKALNEQKLKALQPLWALFQLEQAFENACNGKIEEQPFARSLSRKIPPCMRYRLAAAQAWARGDAAGCHHAIEKAERDLRGVFDPATRKAETALLNRLREKQDQAAGGATRS